MQLTAGLFLAVHRYSGIDGCGLVCHVCGICALYLIVRGNYKVLERVLIGMVFIVGRFPLSQLPLLSSEF
jgi:hypothetical protein